MTTDTDKHRMEKLHNTSLNQSKSVFEYIYCLHIYMAIYPWQAQKMNKYRCTEYACICVNV